MNHDNSGPAFPSNRDMRLNADWDYEPGMSLRDYFAAKAMQGLMDRDWSHMDGNDSDLITTWSVSSYAIADAMLKARQAQEATQ